MEAQVVVDDGVVGVVCLDEVLQSPCLFVDIRLNVVSFIYWDVDSTSGRIGASKETGEG